MGLTPQFTKKDVKDHIKEKLQRIREAIRFRLIRTGEEFVLLARQNGEYIDRTGNLRSSIWYVVLFDGKVISKGFESIKGGKQGLADARQASAKLIAKFPTGYVLICGAGMNYAASVESKGKDVITGTSQTCEVILKAALKRITKK